MPEQSPIEQGGDIKLPSALRIRQRLGHVSTSKVFKQDLAPRIISGAGKTYGESDLMFAVHHTLLLFAKRQSMSTEAVIEHYTPRLIKQLVDDPSQRSRLGAFHRTMMDRIFPSDDEDFSRSESTVSAGYTQNSALEPIVVAGSTPEELGIRAREAARRPEQEFTIFPPNLD